MDLEKKDIIPVLRMLSGRKPVLSYEKIKSLIQDHKYSRCTSAKINTTILIRLAYFPYGLAMK